MDGIDRTSKLPEPILQHILSFLVVKDAARTSVLSKVWNSAWASLSCLDFGRECFRQPKDIVDQILADRKNQKMSIRRFRLRLTYYRSASSYVDEWIKILVACNIKELSLGAITAYQRYHKLTKAIFAAKALNMLSLEGFKLQPPSNGIKFSSLRELHLRNSFLNEQVLQALCASCSDLEALFFSDAHGLTSLQVPGNLPKLRKVNLECCPPQFHNVKIVAPNLTDLYILSFCGKIDVIEITACKTLKKLHLSGVVVTDEWVEQLFSCLSNLEIFFLVNCASVRTIKISSDSLNHLVMFGVNLTSVDLNTPNLRRFFCDVRHGKNKLLCNVDPLPTFQLKASHLRETVLNLIPETIDTNWYAKLTESLGNFNHSEAIELKCNCDEVIVIPKDTRDNLIPPLHNTKSLHVNVHKILHVDVHNRVNHSIVDVVDSLLWASSQLDTLSFGQTRDLKTLKFIHRDAADEDDKPCCASLPLKCWRHKLERVELQNFAREELEKLRSYFVANADILEIVEVPPECSI